jgi:hypothetical protein
VPSDESRQALSEFLRSLKSCSSLHVTHLISAVEATSTENQTFTQFLRACPVIPPLTFLKLVILRR